jgi:hypothetical protein
MAAPSYTEDLTDIDLAQALTNWLQINFAGGGGGALGTGADFAMQGTLCVDRQVTTNERGAMYDNTTGITLGANDHIFQWGFVATPGITDNLATRGAYCIAGTATGALVQFHVEGNDTYGAQGRVGKCYTYRYVNTANTGSIPYRTLTGTPGATSPRYFGFGIKTTAASKGANVGVDAIRYGTGAYLTAGELISAGDASDNPCTFAGFQAQNDTLSNRWGILTSIGGTNYELQGRFVIGQNNAGTPTLARFSDSDKSINIVDTVHSLTDFTQFIIDHASTRCEWTNINITALGTNNPGRVFVNNANPTFIVVNGTWTGIALTTMRSNTDITGLTWRACGLITMNGGTLADCLVDQHAGTHAILTTNPSDITDTNFISSGTGHGVRCDTTGTFDWDGNTDSGYTGARGSNPTSSTGSANAMFYNNSGGLITLNVIGGGQSPSVRNGAGATTVVNASVPVVIAGVTRGTPVKLIARETLGAVTDGDVLAEGFATAAGTVSYSHNDQGSLDISVVARNQGVAVAAIAASVFGSLFVDETVEASSNATADMTLLPPTQALNDAYYFGHNEQFSRLKLDITTAASGGTWTLLWEYWNGTIWTALTVGTDGTGSFGNTGANIVDFTIPGNWATTSVTNQANTGAMYYVRARISAFTSSGTAPVGRKVTLDVSRYLPYDESREIITGSGLTDNVSWRRDTISKFDPND